MWKRLFHVIGHVARILDQEVVLDDGPGDAHRVAFLEGIQADGMRRHLAGDDHHGDAVHVGRGNAGDGIGHARAGGDQRHADVTRGAGVTIGRMHRRLLMAHQHVLDGVLLVERVVNVQHRATGVAPDVLDAFGLQGLDEDFGTAQFGNGELGDFCCGRCRRSDFGFGDFHDQPL
jgi:hypothetical protein